VVCHEQVNVPDGYRRAIRWLDCLAYVIRDASTMVVVENQISDPLATLLLGPVVLGAGTSGLLLSQSVSATASIQKPEPHPIESTDITLSEANHSENKRD